MIKITTTFKKRNHIFISNLCKPEVVTSRTSTQKLTMLKTAIMSIRAVVVMVRVIRGQGLLAIMTDDLSSHIQDVEELLLQCCRHTNTQQHGTHKCCAWL